MLIFSDVSSVVFMSSPRQLGFCRSALVLRCRDVITRPAVRASQIHDGKPVQVRMSLDGTMQPVYVLQQ